MPTKDELLKEAEKKGVEVKKSATKAEIEEALKSNQESSKDNTDEVTVNENRDEEAVHGTEKEGDDSEVKNTDEIKQNGVDSVQTLDVTDSEIAKDADEGRTKEEVEFADEGNPNQKARTASTGDAEVDQDGNPRTGGKSYGVAADNPQYGTPAEQNQPKEEEGDK